MFIKGKVNYKTNVYDVENVIKQVDVASHFYPKCLYSPAIVSDSVGFHQAKNLKAQIPPQEHLKGGGGRS